VLPLLSGRCIPLLLSGRVGWDDTDARLLGRLLLGSREDIDMPNERRLTPESAAPLRDEAVDACDARFLLLLKVTLLGM
jgi:hypothetical protein|tara:strand:+ start:47752 stop:47988 length:237 start_codon:yes stop_codon:yes gene_type:complete